MSKTGLVPAHICEQCQTLFTTLPPSKPKQALSYQTGLFLFLAETASALKETKPMTNLRYANAVFIAAQATMCLLKKVPVLNIQLDQNAPALGTNNHVTHLPAKYWQDNVWIALSGPVARAIHEGRGKNNLFMTRDIPRYEKAFNLCYELVSPRAPSQLKDLLRFDPKSTTEAVRQGNYPEGVHGHLKGALTRYYKEHSKRKEFAEEMLNEEIHHLFKFITGSKSFMGITYLFAEELHERSILNAEDVIDLYCGSYVQMRTQPKLQELVRLAA